MKSIFTMLTALFLPASAMAIGAGMYTLSVGDIEAEVSKAIVANNVAGLAEATLENTPRDTAFAHTGPLSVAIKALQADTGTRRWSANVNFISNNQVVSVVPMQGRFTEMVLLPNANRSIAAGEVISDADIAMKAFPLTMARQSVVRSMEDVVGKTAYRLISANRPLRSEELSTPQVMKKNTGVTIVYQTPTMRITTQGQALSSGAVGDVIQVVNANSKRIIRATVVDANNVAVTPPQLASVGGSHATQN